jgi:glycosyltransferase involved in cell wall biosynthesis
MKLNAICMVKNEADIILESLEHGLQFCDTIYVFDNGSTDGTWEKLQDLATKNSRIVIAFHSDETFKNQLRNRVYNKYHHLYSKNDWWYVLDADEMLAQNPRPMLSKAARAQKQQMRMWQAQFYFTDQDALFYETENHDLPVSQRRRYYRINWREPRFFQNDPEQKWPETVSGRVPPFCKKLYRPSPICCHYADRTPEQIVQRRKIRINNPHSFFHMKNQPAENWQKKAADLFYYQAERGFKFSLFDKIDYYRRELGFWLTWRRKNIGTLFAKCLPCKLVKRMS